MSLDYWRSEDELSGLSFSNGWKDNYENVAPHYYLWGEWDNDVTHCKLTKQDMINLRDSLNLLLEKEQLPDAFHKIDISKYLEEDKKNEDNQG